MQSLINEHSLEKPLKMDGNILYESFKYTLRQWEKWVYADIVMENELILNRGKYSLMFVLSVKSIFENNGYTFKYSTESITRRFMHFWLQLYRSEGKNNRLPIVKHKARADEFEEYLMIFGDDFWEYITEDYIVYNGFDDTNVGYELLRSMPYFFWIYIDIDNSPNIQRKREEEREIEGELRRLIDETDVINKFEIASKEITYEDNSDIDV